MSSGCLTWLSETWERKNAAERHGETGRKRERIKRIGAVAGGRRERQRENGTKKYQIES